MGPLHDINQTQAEYTIQSVQLHMLGNSEDDASYSLWDNDLEDQDDSEHESLEAAACTKAPATAVHNHGEILPPAAAPVVVPAVVPPAATTLCNPPAAAIYPAGHGGGDTSRGRGCGCG